MSLLFLSNLIQTLAVDLEEIQIFQEEAIQQLRDTVHPFYSIECQQKSALPQIKVEEISVNLPLQVSIIRSDVVSNFRLAATIPSSLIPTSPGSFSHLNITFTSNHSQLTKNPASDFGNLFDFHGQNQVT
jgi:hypothetical protein